MNGRVCQHRFGDRTSATPPGGRSETGQCAEMSLSFRNTASVTRRYTGGETVKSLRMSLADFSKSFGTNFAIPLVSTRTDFYSASHCRVFIRTVLVRLTRTIHMEMNSFSSSVISRVNYLRS
jgi:hypothetical protein